MVVVWIVSSRVKFDLASLRKAVSRENGQGKKRLGKEHPAAVTCYRKCGTKPYWDST